MNKIRINLLPWREEAKLLRESAFKKMIASAAVVGVVLGVLALFGVKALVQKQYERTVEIERVIDENYTDSYRLLKESKELIEALQERMEVLGHLDKQRDEIVGIMQGLASSATEGAFIYDITFDVDNIQFDGLATNDQVMISYIEKLEEQVGLAPIPRYSEFTVLDNMKLISFSIKIKPNLGLTEF